MKHQKRLRDGLLRSLARRLSLKPYGKKTIEQELRQMSQQMSGENVRDVR
jgi:hypothetical protein